MERYTDLPLPPYPFLPGVDPHPTADAAGHSYQRGHSMPDWQPPEAWATCLPYLQGCDLFNHGYFWEAHEAWEKLWLSCDRSSVQAHYLQGLIQAANALLKRRMQRSQAVERLRRDALGHLAIAPDHYMGLAVRSWSHQLGSYLCIPNQNFPQLVLDHAGPPLR
jgi:hypothetical protein